jgi:hypothetical protein
MLLIVTAHSTHIPSGVPVAVKQACCPSVYSVAGLMGVRVQIDLESSEDDVAEIQQEIAHLAQCDSPWVTRYYNSFVRGHKLWISASCSLIYVFRAMMELA